MYYERRESLIGVLIGLLIGLAIKLAVWVVTMSIRLLIYLTPRICKLLWWIAKHTGIGIYRLSLWLWHRYKVHRFHRALRRGLDDMATRYIEPHIPSLTLKTITI